MADPVHDGGPAFPLALEGARMPGDYGLAFGMTLRDYFAAHAPVDFSYAMDVYGGRKISKLPTTDEERAVFFAVWTLLRYEYADAMLERRNGGG